MSMYSRVKWSQSFVQVYLMSRGECSLSLTLEKAVHFMDSVVCLVQVWQNDYNPLFHYRAFLRELMHGVLVTRDSVWAIVENVSIPINGAQQSTAKMGQHMHQISLRLYRQEPHEASRG